MGARYSRHTGYTVPKRTTARPTVRTVQRRIKFGPTTAKFIGLIVLAVLAALAVAATGNATTSSYTNTQITSQTAQVNADNQALTLEVDREKSIQTVAAHDPNKQTMVPVDQVGFVAGASTEATPGSSPTPTSKP